MLGFDISRKLTTQLIQLFTIHHGGTWLYQWAHDNQVHFLRHINLYKKKGDNFKKMVSQSILHEQLKVSLQTTLYTNSQLNQKSVLINIIQFLF